MHDVFSSPSCHPVVGFVFFAVVMLFTLCFWHPVLLALSLLSAAVYSFMLGGRIRPLRLIALLALLLAAVAVNALFNQQGVTVLAYLSDIPITRESLLYGAAGGVMILSVILWFSCFHRVMTSDKLICLFGKAAPALSLMFTMVLGLVPRFRRQLQAISHARRCVGKGAPAGKGWRKAARQKAAYGMAVISTLTAWSLENAIETADSMAARGYGLPGRTSYSYFRLSRRDIGLLLVIALLAGVVAVGAALGVGRIRFFPMLAMEPVTPAGLAVYAAYALLCLLPAIIYLLEELRWRRIKSTT